LGTDLVGSDVYAIQLGWGCVVCGLVCLTSSGFSSGLLFSVGVFWPQISIVCVCVCVCVRAWLGAFGVYMILFEQNCNNLKMTAIGRNM